MKKMKFTLGLMLSMLILGANVSRAQTTYSAYSWEWPHRGYIETSAIVTGCDLLADDIHFKVVVVDPNTGGYPSTPSGGTAIIADKFGANHLPLDGVAYKNLLAVLPYGSSQWAPAPVHGSFPVLPAFPSAPSWANQYCDYFWDGGKYVPNADVKKDVWYDQHGLIGYPWSQNYGNLFYWCARNKAQVYNQFEISLKYIAGNELKPVIKKYTTYGVWKTVTWNGLDGLEPVTNYERNNGWKQNQLFSTNVVYEEIVPFDLEISGHHPYEDRKSDTYYYYFKDPILPLLEKYVIYSIQYEIGFYDIIDYPNGTTHPPVAVLPNNPRQVSIETEEGITTDYDLNVVGTAVYVEAGSEFSFNAYSENEITDETVTLYRPTDLVNPYIQYGPGSGFTGPDAKKPIKSVYVEQIADGTYLITIKNIVEAILIDIKSVTATNSEEGNVGNIGITPNNVWSATGTLYVQTSTPSTLSIYSVTGQLITQTTVSGNYSMTLPKGLYIVQVNGKAYKILN